MEIPLLYEIFVLLGASVIVVLISNKLKLPSILGFLITGMLIGPYGLGLTDGSNNVEMLAEIGVILLLFIIGLEFSLKSLESIKNAVFIGGPFQVLLTTLIVCIALYSFGVALPTAVFIGFMVSHSSTSISMKVFQDTGTTSSPHVKISLAISIFQDIMSVPMILLAPMLAGKTSDLSGELITLLIKIVAILIMVYLGAKYIVPKLLHEVAKSKSKELFILTIVVICVSTAWATNQAGLSLALGAFLAGLIISESDYSHQATGNILPFREVFTSIFFVSIGMLLDLSFLFSNISIIILLVICVILIKFTIGALSAKILKYPTRTVLLTGLTLLQIGEFGFILSQVGVSNNLFSREIYQYFIAVSIITMALTPFTIMYGEKFLKFLLTKIGLNIYNKVEKEDEISDFMNDHVIIIGYGINGRNVARAAKSLHIPYIIIEMNAETVKNEKANGENIVYGDGINRHLLEHVNIETARVVVIAISDPTAINKILAAIRQINQTVHIIVRTRFLAQTEEHINLGADEVVPEEFETSIEIFSRVLYKYLVPVDTINEIAESIRYDNYKLFSPLNKPNEVHRSVSYPNLNITILTVNKSRTHVVGKSLGESDIRSNFGVNVIAIRRDEKFLDEITVNTTIQKDDILYLLGSSDSIRKLRHEIQY